MEVGDLVRHLDKSKGIGIIVSIEKKDPVYRPNATVLWSNTEVRAEELYFLEPLTRRSTKWNGL